MPLTYTIQDNNLAYANTVPRFVSGYSPRNPKIDCYVNGDYWGSTNHVKNLKQALVMVLVNRQEIPVGSKLTLVYSGKETTL